MGRDAAIILAGRFLQALLSIAALRVMTAFLSPAQVGNMYLILSFVTGFAFFFVSPVGMYINRKLHAWQTAGTIMARLSIFNIYIFIVSAAAIFLTIAARKLLGASLDLPVVPFALLVAAYLFFNTWNMTLVPALNMLGYRAQFVFFSILTTAVGLLFSAFAAMNVSATAFSWLSGQVAAMLLINVIAVVMLWRAIGEPFKGFRIPFRDINPVATKSVVAFALPLSFATLFMWLQNQGYRLIVERQVGAEFLGYLGVGMGIAASLAAVSETLVQQIYAPVLYKKINSGGPEQRMRALSEYSEKTVPAYLILLFFTVSLSPQLTGLLVDAKFHDATKFVVFGAFIEFFRMVSNVISSAAHSEMRTRMLIKPYAVGGVITCAGVYAAGMASAMEYLIPAALIFGGAITLLVIRREALRLVPFSLNRRLLTRTALFSLPLLILLSFRDFTSPVWSVGILSCGGMYFLLLQYLVAFKWTKGGAGMAWKDVGGAAPARPC